MAKVGRANAVFFLHPTTRHWSQEVPETHGRFWILEVPGQPTALMLSDETKSPSLGSGANCNLGHIGIYLAEKWDWVNVNKISLVHLALLGQLLILEK